MKREQNYETAGRLVIVTIMLSVILTIEYTTGVRTRYVQRQKNTFFVTLENFHKFTAIYAADSQQTYKKHKSNGK
jgi:hypothetical protein